MKPLHLRLPSLSILLFCLVLLLQTTHQACHPTCFSCSEDDLADKCTACDAAHNRALVNGNPGPCTCTIGYIDDADTSTNPACTANSCSNSCLGKCQGTATNCMGCVVADHRQLIGSECKCPSGYADLLPGSSICLPCISKCKECSNGDSICTQCYLSQFRTLSTNNCICLQGYYDDSTDICKKCSFQCSTCTTSASACDTCISNTNRQSSPDCTCVAKFFDDGSAVNCVACDYSCATCTISTACLTCDLTKKRVMSLTTTFCDCVDRYYSTGTDELCVACHNTCLTCSAPADTNCVTCNSVSKRIKSTTGATAGKCVCMAGYYETASTVELCSMCHYTCGTCSGGSTSSNCLTCDSTRFRIFSSGSCPCMDGYYSNADNFCIACDSSCATCSSTACLTCPSASQVINAVLGICECPNTKVWSSTTSSCVSCAGTCSTCSVSPTNCTSCDSTTQKRVLLLNACVCSVGYKEGAAGTVNCAACPSTCVTCDATGCLTCDSSSKRIKSGTACICASGFYDDGTNVLCQSCASTCTSCTSSATNCNGCDTTKHFRSLSGATCNCLDGYFDPNNGSPICSRCNIRCLTCATSSTNCLTCAGAAGTRTGAPACLCIAGTYADAASASCPSCHYSCATCDSNSACLTCDIASNRQLSSLTNLCTCIIRYYNSGTTVLCAACHNTCLTCSAGANNNCLTCNSISMRTLSTLAATAGKCVCMAGFYETNANIELCASCHYSCATCSGGTSTNCLTCDSTLFRIFNTNSCPCMDGYYINSNNICDTCDLSCSTCSSTGCLTCPVPSMTINALTGLCVCPSNQIWDGVTMSCAACDSTCSTCSIGITNCTSCDGVTQKRVLSINTCMCAIGYKQGTGGSVNCVACDYTCVTCDATGCIQCDSSSQRTKSGTSCICMAGFYDDGTNMLCQSCPLTCSSCTSSTTCDGCDTTLNFRTLSGIACNCLDGYFDPNSGSPICSKCVNRCGTCETTATNCLTCAGVAGTKTIAPACLCNAGTFDDGLSADCLPCHYSCNTCQSSSACLSCNSVSDHRTLNIGTGLCICMTRYYDDGTHKVCRNCDATCLTCSGAANTNCLTCNSTAQRTFDSNSGKCLCKAKFYQTSATTEKCSTCHPTCLTCSDGNIIGCLTCSVPEQRTLDATANKCLCINGFYLDMTTFACRSCHYTCLACTSPTPCISCPYPTQTISSTGICGCLNTQVWDPVGTACIPCHYSCATCSSTTTNCTTCNVATNFRSKSGTACLCIDGYYDTSVAVCTACAYSCLTCDATGCLSCNSNSHRYLSGTSCLCFEGFYDDSSHSMCLKCHYSCKTCTTGSACTNCNTLLFRVIDTNNLCKCSILFYQDVTSLTCQPCQYGCASCTIGNRCLTCNSAMHRTINTTTTLCQCDVGYFDDYGIALCKQCLSDCLTCTDQSKCTSCDLVTKHRVLDPATVRCICATRYYEDTSVSPYVCASCIYSCLTCKTGTNCATCNSQSFRTINLITGQCVCFDGYYDDGTNQLCKPCHYSCAKCVDATSCSNCDLGTLRTVTTTCTCPTNNYYDDGSTKVCNACQYSCQTCTSTISCTGCNSAKFRTMDTSSSFCKCLDGYYDDRYSNQLCVKCPYQCQTCNNASLCQTCNTAVNKRYSPLAKCLCIDGFYDDGINPLCVTCQYTCKTCISGSICKTCNALKFRQLDQNARLCVCMKGYFDTGTSAELCSPCSYTCQTCVTSSTYCLTCINSTFRTWNSITHTCSCNKYYYDDLVNPQCLPCHYSCLTCIDSRTCATCEAILKRQTDPTTDLCKCSIRYFDDGNNNRFCIACDPTCLTCDRLRACKSCDATALRLLNTTANYLGIVSPLCTCKYKFCPGATPQSTCLPCHYSCGQCKGTSMYNCLYCSADAKRIIRAFNATSNTCLCQDGYYDDGLIETCLACHAWCRVCTSPVSTTCTACSPTYFLKADVTSCFQFCPSQFFGNVLTMLCTPCSSNCLTCLNANLCTVCKAGWYLYQNACINPCPTISTFLDVPNNKCVDCTIGCLTCLNLLSCQSCKPGYYFDNQLSLCFACNSQCKACIGPAQNQCTDCSYPLYLNVNQCINITCSYGKYIDSFKGCVDCPSHFANSVTCNINEPTLCQDLYRKSQGQCVYCTKVTGFFITEKAECSQICGDGIVIDYQCDDGNNLNGDGCANNCLVQKGWNCHINANRLSVCALDGAVTFTFVKAVKFGGQNKIKVYLELSVPIRLNAKYFSLSFNGLVKQDSIQWTFSQLNTNLQQIDFTIAYTQNIDNKQFQLSYNTNRPSRLLQSTTISLSLDQVFTLESYPPAIYTSQQQQLLLSTQKSAIFILCLLLIILSAVNLLFPRKMYIHIINSVCLPAQIYIFYGLVAESTTDYVKWSLEGISGLAFVGGYKISKGDDLAPTPHFGYSVEVTKNLGFIGAIMIGLWVIYALLIFFKRYCWKKNISFMKLCMYFRYFVITVQLCVLPHVAYSSINALYNQSLTSYTSSFNVCLAIFIHIYLLGFIISLFISTKSLKLNQLMLVFEEMSEFSEQDNEILTNRPKSRQLMQSKQDFIMETYSREDRENKTIYAETSRLSLEEHQLKKDEDKGKDKKIAQNEGIGYYYNHLQIYKKVQDGYLHEWLIYDYAELYQIGKRPNQAQISPENGQDQTKIPTIRQFSTTKYYLPANTAKVYMLSVICSLSQTQHFILYCLLSAVLLTNIMFLIIVRPFRFTFSNFRLIFQDSCLLIVSAIMAYWEFGVWQGWDYNFLMEKAITGLLVAVIAIFALLLLIQTIGAWRMEIWNKLEPCLISMRLRGARQVMKYKKSRPKLKIAEPLMEKNKNEKEEKDDKDEPMNAFFVRMIEKEIIEKQYRKQRMLKNPKRSMI